MTQLIELAVKSTVVAGAALTLLAMLGRRSAAERSWVAHAALVVLAALPVAVMLLPRWRLLPPVKRTLASTPEAALSAAPSSAAPTIDPAMWLQTLYGAGVILLILATLLAVYRLLALRRGATVLADPHWLTALARAKVRMKVRSSAALLVSEAVSSPVSWGLIRPTIVINDGLVAAKHDAEAVIAHELAHVARLDWIKLIGGRLVVALFWFNPLVWVLAGQCHQLREEAADDAVLGAEVSSADYASLLVEAARCQGRGFLAVHGVAPGKGSLHRRVTRVLDAAVRRTPTPTAWALGVVAGAAVLAAPLAAATVERAEPSAVTIRGTQAAGAPPRPIVTPRNPAGVTMHLRPKVTPRATTIPPRPVVARRKADRATTPPPPVVIPHEAGAAVAPAAATISSGKGRTAEPAASSTKGVAPRGGKLTLASAPASPSLIGQPGSPRLTVSGAASPRAPKMAVASRSTPFLGEPGGKIVLEDGLTMVRDEPLAPRTAVTVTGKTTATSSSSSSHTTTTNGRTVRVESARDNADRADRRADERDSLADEKDRRADEQERRNDEAERRRDEAERRKDQEERNARRTTAQEAAAIARTADAARRDKAYRAADEARAAKAADRDRRNAERAATNLPAS